FVIPARSHQHLAKLRPDILQMRIAHEQCAKCGDSFIEAALIGEVKCRLDFLQMADLIARIRQRAAPISRRADVTECREFARFFRIDALCRGDRRGNLLQFATHRCDYASISWTGGAIDSPLRCECGSLRKSGTCSDSRYNRIPC